MTRALKYDIPGIDWRLDPENIRGGLSDLFGGGQGYLGLTVEIGFGRGEFLIEQASNEPNTAFLGIEVSHKRCLKLARKLARTELTNVRLIEMRAERAVSELLPWSSVSQIWINYPDPWPKKRHIGRRLITRAFVRDLALRLAPGAALDVATDHPAYASNIDECLSREPLLENTFAPDPFLREVADRMPTSYELEWRALGRDLHFFKYRRRQVDTIETHP
jgi:tRNA (guanine-N7-)-methyltransferase